VSADGVHAYSCVLSRNVLCGQSNNDADTESQGVHCINAAVS
jgi:hypothetical protein